MRRSVPILSALVVVLGGVLSPCASAQNPPAENTANAPAAKAQVRQRPAPDPQKLEQLLIHWESNSSNLKTLDVTMTRTDRSPAWGEDDHYRGRAMFKTPNRAWLDFEKEKEVVDPKSGAKKMQFVPHERIICTGSEVWQYRCDTKQVFVYPLEKDVQQRALEEGPLPFLFNFQAAAAKQRYEMALVEEDADSSLILIIPLLEIDKQSFKKAFVTLDRKLYLLPRRIFLVDPDGKSSKDFVLTLNPQVANKVVQDANFVGQEIKGWKLVRNPGGDAPAPGAPRTAVQPAPGGAAAPGQQPAMRSRLFGGRRN